jgi:hypothetical protein
LWSEGSSIFQLIIDKCRNMKIKTGIAAFLISSSIFAQYNLLQQNNQQFTGGFGLTWIDGAPNYAFRITPEFQFSKIGVGLDLNLEFTASGKIRAEDFNNFSDYLSIIRYVRYGQKNDPLFIKAGVLDFTTLGHGSIMYLYNNSPSFDNRKTGLEVDGSIGNYGFEAVYGNFARPGVAGFRGYVRPLQSVNIPILSKIETGFTIAEDLDSDAGISAGNYNPSSGVIQSAIDDGHITIIGIDLGLPLLRIARFSLDSYIDYAKIVDFGGGVAAGLSLNYNGLGLINLGLKLERRFNEAHYIPSYFDPLYEIERFNLDAKDGTIVSRVQLLKGAVDPQNGYFGELNVSAMGFFQAAGSFQKLDNDSKSGVLHLVGEFLNNNFPYVFRAGYDKLYILNFHDLVTLDNRSNLYFEFGYKIEKYLMLSMIYYWTFTPVRDSNDNIIGYAPQKRIEPRVSFIYPLNFK